MAALIPPTTISEPVATSSSTECTLHIGDFFVMMHSAIVVVTWSPDHYEHQNLMSFWATIEPDQAATPLAEQVWLIDVQKSPAAFARFVDACERHRFSYRILAIKDAPQWLPPGSQAYLDP